MGFLLRKGQLNRHTDRQGFLAQGSFLREGQLETTHANAYRVGHYHTKHCHAAVVSLGGLTHR